MVIKFPIIGFAFSWGESDRVTLLISRFKEQNLPVTRSLGSVIC